MSLREPPFWYPEDEKSSVMSLMLQPAALAFDIAGRARRLFVSPAQADVPVVCIGNLVAGGVGKTPVSIAVAHQLAAKGRHPYFLSRGYGGTLTGPVSVNVTSHTAMDVGDEPMLLARHFPTIVSRDRPAGACLAVELGADVIIMDDGFQNPSLKKDLSLVVVDGVRGFGNGRIIPAGPLREPIRVGLSRADGVIMVGDDRGVGALIRDVAPSVDLVQARIEPIANQPMERKRRYLAFSGIGDPGKFFDTVKAYGLPIAGEVSFADHHVFSKDEINDLRRDAEKAHAYLITTEKDWQRLPDSERDDVWYLQIEVRFDDTARLEAALKPIFAL